MQFFFNFTSRYASSAVTVCSVGLSSDTSGIEDHWNLIKGMYSNILFPVIFKEVQGKKMTDILDTGWAGLFLISNRLKIILEENHLTGWKAFPIRLYDKKVLKYMVIMDFLLLESVILLIIKNQPL